MKNKRALLKGPFFTSILLQLHLLFKPKDTATHQLAVIHNQLRYNKTVYLNYNKGGAMSSVKLSSFMVQQAKITSKALNRSIAGQIEHWAKIGKLAEENPDLTYDFIKNLLIAQQEAYAGKLSAYTFESPTKL